MGNAQLTKQVKTMLVMGHDIATRAFNSSSLIGMLNWEAHTAPKIVAFLRHPQSGPDSLATSTYIEDRLELSPSDRNRSYEETLPLIALRPYLAEACSDLSTSLSPRNRGHSRQLFANTGERLYVHLPTNPNLTICIESTFIHPLSTWLSDCN